MNNLELQDLTPQPMSTEHHESSEDWMAAFNTSLVSTRSKSTKDKSEELHALMGTPEFACLLIASQELAERLNLTKEEATERMITTFRQVDQAWMQYLIQKGIDKLSEE
jgi:hypothetical protein